MRFFNSGTLSYLTALLKQQGVGVKGASKSAPVNEEVPPLLEVGGKIEVCLLIKSLLRVHNLVTLFCV